MRGATEQDVASILLIQSSYRGAHLRGCGGVRARLHAAGLSTGLLRRLRYDATDPRLRLCFSLKKVRFEVLLDDIVS